jgi:hypothetical protein
MDNWLVDKLDTLKVVPRAVKLDEPKIAYLESQWEDSKVVSLAARMVELKVDYLVALSAV